MSDLHLQIDAVLLARLHELAHERDCTIQTLAAWLLREGLSSIGASAVAVTADPDAIGFVATHWSQEETAFLRAAARAVGDLPVDETIVRARVFAIQAG